MLCTDSLEILERVFEIFLLPLLFAVAEISSQRRVKYIERNQAQVWTWGKTV